MDIEKKLADAKLTDEALEQVVGGRKVMVITYMKNGKINAYHQDFRGDIKKLEQLAKGGSVSSLKLDASWGLMKGIPKNKLALIKKNYQRMGYQIIESHER